MDRDICIFSFNSRGFDTCKQDFVRQLANLSGDTLPIICNQENFLLKSNSYIINQSLPDHHIFFKHAIKVGLEGRPKCGFRPGARKKSKGGVRQNFAD